MSVSANGRTLTSAGAVSQTAQSERLLIVDICEIAYDSDSWRAYLRAFASEAPHYLHAFARRLCEQAGADVDLYVATLRDDPYKAVDLLVAAGRLDLDAERHVQELRAQGVTHQAIYGGMWAVPGGNVNDRVAATAVGRPELSFWAGISLRDAVAAERELRRAHQTLGATGLSVIPFLDDADVLDPAFTPVFSYAADAGLLMWIHCGMSFASTKPIDACSWREVDRLAGRHPELVIIVGHGGWPWMTEMAAVAQRHRNVYLDSSTHRGSAMAGSGYGWEPVLARADGVLRRKLLFGSVTWVSGLTPRQLADEIVALDLQALTTKAWLGENAARLLGLSVARVSA